MIKKLRNQFITITATALLIVIVLLIASINGLFFYQNINMLNQRMDFLLMHQSDNKIPPANEPPKDRMHFDKKDTPVYNLIPQMENDMKNMSDGCVFALKDDMTVTIIKQNPFFEYTTEELTNLADTLIHKKQQGWYQNYRYRVITPTDSETDFLYVIGIINASQSLYQIFTVLIISFIIGVVFFTLVLVIIILASKRAIKPIAESYEKQKQFVTDAGHELKTPLTVISGNNELSKITYGESEWFDNIDKQVAKMNSLVRNLITLAKMDEEQKPVFEAFNLSDATFDTAKSFENLILSQSKNIELEINDGLTYKGDESKIRQVIAILIDNAVKYCDANGKITVKLYSDKQIKLQVINDYKDVNSCHLDKLFERFYREDKARTSDGSYGLGLSIAKSIVDMHQSKLCAKKYSDKQIMFEIVFK